MFDTIINSVADLQQLLFTNGIDVNLYDKGSAKSLENLLKEVVEGESILSLADSKLSRIVRGVFIHINQDGKVLTETNQFFHATSSRSEWSRQRRCVLAEKLHPGEAIYAAVPRALEEELGLVLPSIVYTALDDEVRIGCEEEYPGLLSIRHIYHVHIEVDQLGVVIPDGYTHTECFADGSPRVTATWNWC